MGNVTFILEVLQVYPALPNWNRFDLKNELGGCMNIEGDYNDDGFKLSCINRR